MYRNHDNRPSVVNGIRISHGPTVRDDAQRLRLAGILNKMKCPVVKSAEASVPKDKPTEKKYRHCLNKLGLAKYNTSPNATEAANNIRARKDALKSASSGDGSDVIAVKRKRSFDNNLNNNNNNNTHGKETTLHLEAKRQKIEPASLKQDIDVEYTEYVYACVKSPAGGLKLHFTRVSSGAGGDSQSSRKRKRQC